MLLAEISQELNRKVSGNRSYRVTVDSMEEVRREVNNECLQGRASVMVGSAFHPVVLGSCQN